MGLRTSVRSTRSESCSVKRNMMGARHDAMDIEPLVFAKSVTIGGGGGGVHLTHQKDRRQWEVEQCVEAEHSVAETIGIGVASDREVSGSPP